MNFDQSKDPFPRNQEQSLIISTQYSHQPIRRTIDCDTHYHTLVSIAIICGLMTIEWIRILLIWWQNNNNCKQILFIEFIEPKQFPFHCSPELRGKWEITTSYHKYPELIEFPKRVDEEGPGRIIMSGPIKRTLTNWVMDIISSLVATECAVNR